MSTPVMLHTSTSTDSVGDGPADRARVAPGRAPSAAASLIVALLAALCFGLFGVGVFAVYDWTTPDDMGVIAATLAAVFAVVVVLMIATPVTARLRRGR